MVLEFNYIYYNYITVSCVGMHLITYLGVMICLSKRKVLNNPICKDLITYHTIKSCKPQLRDELVRMKNVTYVPKIGHYWFLHQWLQ